MNDHDALLRAIGENPEEDTPRLMYADWLEENGDPDRADFVRNQVELARIDLNDRARHPLVRKNVRYLTNFVPSWRSLLPRIDNIQWGDFNRGLIEEVQANEEWPVVNHAAEIFAVPGIHILRLRTLSTSSGTLGRVSQMSRLRALRLVAAGALAGMLRDLFASPNLSRLRILDLHGNRADDAVAADIADGRFPDLTELWLGSNAIGNDGAAALAATRRHLMQIQLLDLRNNPITDRAARYALRRRFGSALKL
jgi:uncharacterized protein (TIGR02996 family)